MVVLEIWEQTVLGLDHTIKPSALHTMAAPAPVSTGSGSKRGCIIQYLLLSAPDWIQPQASSADRVYREKDLRQAALPSLPPSVHIIFDLTGSPIWLSSITRCCCGSLPTAKAELPRMAAALQSSCMLRALGMDRLHSLHPSWHNSPVEGELIAHRYFILGPCKSLEVNLICMLQHNINCHVIESKHSLGFSVQKHSLPNRLPSVGFYLEVLLSAALLYTELVRKGQNLGTRICIAFGT